MNNLVLISDELNADILTLSLKRTTFSEKKLSNAKKYVGIESALCGSEILSFVLFMVGKKGSTKVCIPVTIRNSAAA